ncbi:MAG: O-antigen ligase family protein [Terrimesophilobacter sp.]
MFENPRWRVGYATVGLFVLLAGDALRFTVGWWVFSILTVAVTIVSLWLLFAERHRWRVNHLPYPLLLFLALATVSIVWSHYPASTALGLFTTWVIVVNGVAFAIALSWTQLLGALSHVLRFVIGASLLFELFVSTVIRARVLPLFGQPGVDYGSYKHIPGMLMWSRNELFDVFGTGRIQGILGNSNSLGFLALLGLIVFSIQFATHSDSRRTPGGRGWSRSRRASGVWIVLAAASILMTKSATVTLALVGVVIVAVVVLSIRRAHTPRGRTIVASVTALAVVAVGVVLVLFRGEVLALLGKSSDLTGRLGIWRAVIGLAQERPVFGWGWISYWVPWADPFDHLVYRAKVLQLQAHNTWLDVVFQLGIVGLVVFVLLVAVTAVKAWQHAVDRPQSVPMAPQSYTAITMLGLLILTALIVQSFAESRLITEYGLALLVVVAVKTKRRELL